MARVLYITYDGLMEPLGMSQVWQYLKVLSKNNNITIISFEKSADLLDKDRLSCLCNEVDSYGVSWRRLKYHKTPSIMATAYDIVRGILLGVFIVKKSKIEIIHARSYVPALVALVINKLLNIKFIFDMRGFWADEKVDGEAWSKNSLVYKITKKLECGFLTNASSIVSLTNIGRNDVLSLDCMKNTRKKIVVIPTCVNLQLFQQQHLKLPVHNNDIDHHFVLGYVGSVGTFYLFDEVLKSFRALLKVKKNSKLLIINKGQHEYILNKISDMGISESHVEIKSVAYDKVAVEISRMDAGIFYIKPVFSKRSSSPTKFGEFLGCGKPCISNFGVGDTESVLEGENVGIVLKSFSESEHVEGINRLLELIKDKNIQERCTQVAKAHFSLGLGVEKYNNIYKQLVNK